MAWAQATDYIAAGENPAARFREPELASGQPAKGVVRGLPFSCQGKSAIVFKMVCPGDNVWAVKCFTRRVADQQDRYHHVSEHLQTHRRKFAVDFRYLA